jgi:hypothetical protein
MVGVIVDKHVGGGGIALVHVGMDAGAFKYTVLPTIKLHLVVCFFRAFAVCTQITQNSCKHVNTCIKQGGPQLVHRARHHPHSGRTVAATSGTKLGRSEMVSFERWVT